MDKNNKFKMEFYYKNPKLDFINLKRCPSINYVLKVGNNTLETEILDLWSYYNFGLKKIDFIIDIIENKYMQKLFYLFLKQEHSEENLDFYFIVKDFKKDINISKDKVNLLIINYLFKMINKLEFIYKTYLVQNSSKMINIDCITVKQIEKDLQNPNINILNSALKQVI